MFNREPLNKYDLAWLGLPINQVDEFLRLKDFVNPFENKTKEEIEHRGLREVFLMYQPEYIYYTAKILLNVELYPLQCSILKMLFTHAFPMLVGSRGFSKTWLLAVYSLLRMILFPGTKVVVAASAFRQTKFLYEYAETIYANSPILQSIYKNQDQPSARLADIWKFTLGTSTLMAIPLGTGDKIRGLRANIIIADEFDSINTEIYEIVINNFASVSMNPVDNMKEIAKRKAMIADGLVVEQQNKLSKFSNQSIISGTMKYEFNPMAIYWKKYRKIIQSKGEKIEEEFGEAGQELDWRDFCIMRIPYELIPKGFMDDKVIARAKATMHSEFYAAEFGTCPISDSLGFFKRSLIETCVASNKHVLSEAWPPWCPEPFDIKLRGDNQRRYVMGIDPAYNQDNLAIILLELWNEHARIVYAWSTSKRSFNKSGVVDEKNYFNFCARKVRNLMKNFNIGGIAIDTQGGGYALMEALQDDSKLQDGEVPLWPVILEDKEQDTDDRAGNHCLHLIQFSDANWTATSNHGMKKDMEDKVLLFPQYNTILLGLASEKDKQDLEKKGYSGDALEDCMLEVEELKDELALIMRSTTPSGRERWDTPEIKINTDKKDRMRKDRYSALLMANYLARTISRAPIPVQFNALGAAKGTTKKPEPTSKLYVGPEWFDGSANLFRHVTRG